MKQSSNKTSPTSFMTYSLHFCWKHSLVQTHLYKSFLTQTAGTEPTWLVWVDLNKDWRTKPFQKRKNRKRDGEIATADWRRPSCKKWTERIREEVNIAQFSSNIPPPNPNMHVKGGAMELIRRTQTCWVKSALFFRNLFSLNLNLECNRKGKDIRH